MGIFSQSKKHQLGIHTDSDSCPLHCGPFTRLGSLECSNRIGPANYHLLWRSSPPASWRTDTRHLGRSDPDNDTTDISTANQASRPKQQLDSNRLSEACLGKLAGQKSL